MKLSKTNNLTFPEIKDYGVKMLAILLLIIRCVLWKLFFLFRKGLVKVLPENAKKTHFKKFNTNLLIDHLSSVLPSEGFSVDNHFLFIFSSLFFNKSSILTQV